MKIGIIGSGAMGSVYGALLADAGNDVWMFDKWREHVAAMAMHGTGARPHAPGGKIDVAAHCRAAPAA